MHIFVCRFALAEFCTTMAHAAHVDVLVALGLDLEADSAKMQEWHVAGKSITLRMASEEHCQFLREDTHTRLIKSPKGILSVTTVKDYYYKVQRESLECSARQTFNKS